GQDGSWDSSSWVGLNGLGQNSTEILQTGVAHNVDGNGNPGFIPWFEWFVAADVVTPEPPNTPDYVFQKQYTNLVIPKPGDTMYGKVVLQRMATGTVTGGTATLWNKTITASNNMMTVSLAPPPNASTTAGTSAEWIFEAPGLDPTRT